MKTTVYAIAGALFLTSGGEVIAQELDDCSPILSEKLLDKRIDSNSKGFVASEHYWTCGESEKRISAYIDDAKVRRYSHDGKVGWSILNIAGDWNANTSDQEKRESIQNWKTQFCTNKDSAVNYSAAGFTASQFLDPEQIKAWRDCKENQLLERLSCYAKPGDRDIVIVFSWRSEDPDLPTVTEMYTLSNGVRQEVEHETTLFKGPKTISVPWDSQKSLRFVMNARLRQFNKSCTVYVPNEVDMHPREVESLFSFGPPGHERSNTDQTVWEGKCPSGQKVISGTCISKDGPVPLQNFGPEWSQDENIWKWTCTWVTPMKSADVRATCSE